MQIKVKRKFEIQVSPTKIRVIEPGIYDVPGDVDKETAEKISRYGKAEYLNPKKAPENKVIAESQSKVAKKPRSRRRSRTKSDD